MTGSITKGTMRFRHGSGASLFIALMLIMAGGGLIYVAVADPEATPGVMVFLAGTGASLALLGAKLAFGLQRVVLDLGRQSWQIRSGLFKRYEESGTFDQFDHLSVEAQDRKHGASSYQVYRLAVITRDGPELHLDIINDHDQAMQMARLIAGRLGIEVRELQDDEDE